MTYFLVVCIGGGVVEMDIWSKIFAGNFGIIFKVCVCTEREEGVRQIWTGVSKA